MFRLFCGLCLFTAGSLGATWNYDRCSPLGPAGWEGKCQGQTEGTPINLCGGVNFPGTVPTMVLSSSYSESRSMKIKNPGYTIEIGVISNNPTLQIGDLSRIVGRSTSNETFTWVLAQMHMHWGRLAMTNEGSEHYMEGKRYPLEAHFVHYNSIYGNVSTAAGKSDGLLVVGVFFEEGTSDLPAMQVIANNIATATKDGVEMSSPVTLTEFFSPSDSFYSYGGGLTTPGCNEAVTWVVKKNVKKITLTTLAKFWAAKASSTSLISEYGNYRPIQTIGSRTVYVSDGGSSSCTTTTDPTFTCSSAGFMASPSFFQAALLMLVLAFQPF